MARGVSVFLVMLIILSAPALAFGTRASSRIDRSSARIKAGTDGYLWVHFSVTAPYTMEDIGASEITIQRYNGSRWIVESTLTPEDAPEMQANDAIRHSASIPYKPEYSGFAYRAVVSVYATDSSGTSTTSVTSAQVTV